MNRKLYVAICAGLLVVVGVTACTPNAVTPTAQPTAPTLTPVATSTIKPQPTSTSLPAPTSTPISMPTPIVTTLPATSSLDNVSYLDDRSDAAAVIKSLFNAINRHEFTRAYSYWENSPQRPDFQQFETGYQGTASVQVTVGALHGDAGAGQFYSLAPVTLRAQTNQGEMQTFAGCYLLHLSQPAIQGVPPFQPLGVQTANIQPVPDGANTTDLMTQACDALSPDAPPLPPQPIASPEDISANQYIDNRSDPMEVLHSLFNAINRREYLRAYSYWESDAQNLPDFTQFQQGYANTQSVHLTTGAVTSNAGAGQFYYQVPVALNATLNDGTTQSFVGCYQLHLSNPGIQTAPPFQPLGIRSANVQSAASDADLAQLMAQACTTQ